MIIVLEGIDNAGKTTLANDLYEHLKSRGKKVVISKELTTDVGDLIKSNIKGSGLSPVMKTFLFAADRQARIEKLSPISDDEIIIFDRYLHSAVVYREAEGLDGNWVKEINKYIPKSDFAFYIDITPEESINRNTDLKFNIHYSLEHLDKVRQAYLKYVEAGELIRIDGMKGSQYVKEKVLKIIESRG